MSITLEQSMCNHIYDKNGYCNLCGYINLMHKQLNEIVWDKLDITFEKEKRLRVDYISDLHTDFWVDCLNKQSPKFDIEIDEFVDMLKPQKGRVLLLGGDQGHYFQQDSEVILKLKKYYDHILIVMGNHDMYLESGKQEKKYRWDSMNRLFEMETFCDAHDGIHYMDGKIIEIDEFKFGGIGMWHDNTYGLTLGYSPEKIDEAYYKLMNDSKYIFVDGKKNYSIPYGYGGVDHIRHFKPLERYKKQRAKLDRMSECHVMLTHYGPKVPEELPFEFQDIDTSYYYFDGLEDIKRLKPHYWVHGHTHTTSQELVGGTKILTNALGRPSENRYTIIKSFYL